MISRISAASTPSVVALVTGGAKRIGKAIVEDLAAHGFAVAIHCNGSMTEGEALVEMIKAKGGRAAVIQADLGDPAAVRGLTAKAQSVLGPVRLLINNASVFVEDHVGNLAEDIWERHFALHLKAPVFLAESMAAALPEGQDGLIVNIIDQRVWKTNPQFFSYTLSKTALWSATRTLAQALAPRIRVNAIGPGPTLPSERQDRRDFQRQVDAIPLRQGPALSEFGLTIRYLWEMKSVTGQMIALDGGQHLAWETPDILGISE
ncbi:NAD(P)-dependent dehydrogenase (short-subunit alcohol dehydrogenase family) [Phyllobacterium leguminum]|uniref:NAD(P)-dependent dehydrogenase (Short-subunit alcohol dehydrogenase family) n=1 Tax=Phyllobacterium leguminum TaxID=314237 RepID=A0A318T0M3_9HYPH|nr:SDR family oxidoreductase [Phyllobacterium leguminum]PYE87234.1 NAD(P)-dependent dehydrogenase (short-subunit alcohol dehydrogenase family) [Phyllobacterium leguminum]